MYSGLGLTPPAAMDFGQATAYDFVYVWDGRQWQVERQDFVIEGDLVSFPERLAGHPYLDVLNVPPPPYRVVSRYYVAEQNGNRFWQHLGINRNYY